MSTHLAHPVDPLRTICCTLRTWVPADRVLEINDADEEERPEDLCAICDETIHVLGHVFEVMEEKGHSPKDANAEQMSMIVEKCNAKARELLAGKGTIHD